MRGPRAGIPNSRVFNTISESISNTNTRAFINSWNSIGQTFSRILASTVILFNSLSAILDDLDHPLSRFEHPTPTIRIHPIQPSIIRPMLAQLSDMITDMNFPSVRAA